LEKTAEIGAQRRFIAAVKKFLQSQSSYGIGIIFNPSLNLSN
jgi:hypothetical protein